MLNVLLNSSENVLHHILNNDFKFEETLSFDNIEAFLSDFILSEATTSKPYSSVYQYLYDDIVRYDDLNGNLLDSVDVSFVAHLFMCNMLINEFK